MTDRKRSAKRKAGRSSAGKAAPPKRTVRVCATGCRALGALDVYRAFERELKAAKLDGKIRLVKTGCQGLCAGAPLVSIDPDDILYIRVKEEDVKDIIKSTLIDNKVIEKLCYSHEDKPITRRSKIPFFAFQKKRPLIPLPRRAEG